MKDFTSYGKKALRNACILSDDQLKLIDEVKGFSVWNSTRVEDMPL